MISKGFVLDTKIGEQKGVELARDSLNQLEIATSFFSGAREYSIQ